MSTIRTRGKLALVVTLAAAAVGSAAPAHAGVDATPADCDVRLERLVAQFYEMEARRGYEAASEWWQPRWHAYYQSCVVN